MGCLPLVVLRAQVVPYGRDERVQLCEECDRPHDVHGGGGEDEGRAPDTISKRQLLLQIADVYMYVCMSVPGKACGASLPSHARRAGRPCERKRGEGEHVRLVLPLGREDPRRCAEDGRDHEADERCPAVPSLASVCTI